MEKSTFCETIKELLSDLGEIVIQSVKKPQGDYTGLMVKTTSSLSPVVNLDVLYEWYYCKDKYDVETCAAIARDILITANEEMPKLNPDDFLDWDKAKDKLFLRLVRDPSNNIARKVADLFLIACVQIEGDGTSLFGVVPELLDKWGVDEDTVFEQAKSVQENIRPLKFGCLPDILGLDVEETERDMYLVSVEQGINGASAIFYDGVFDKLREVLGDFYLIPSSINEFLAMAKAKVSDVKELACFVKFTNATNVDPRDRLSDSVYEYDFDKGEFRKVEC